MENPGNLVSFVDIKYTFDEEGNLQTDLHIKETGSLSYLHFSSSLPDHIFSGIVYSSTSLVRGFWDEIFWPSKPRTTEEPRTGEGLRKVDIWTTF